MDYIQNQRRTSQKVSCDQKRLLNWVQRETQRIFPFLCSVGDLREALWTIDLWIAFEGKDTDSGTLMANGKVREINPGNDCSVGTFILQNFKPEII